MGGLATTIRVRGKWNPAISGLAIVGEEVPPIIECIERRRQRGWDSGPTGSLKTPTSTPKKAQSDAVSASSNASPGGYPSSTVRVRVAMVEGGDDLVRKAEEAMEESQFPLDRSELQERFT